ncbi:MAG: LuxR C-terminal-related transcriptional regulator [Solirubrobacterales bacterium]
MRVALADDHAVVRDGLRPFLNQLAAEVEVIEAETFGGLIDKTERAGGDVDLCILDLRMPDMDPMTGLGSVTTALPGVKVAVLSSITDPRTIREALGKGAKGFIPKKLGAEAIVSALRLVLAGETFVPSIMLGGRETQHSDAKTDDLTIRERNVMALLREGMSNKGIARRLNISEVTVKTHLTNAFRKLDVHNRVQAARVWQIQVD